MSDQSTASDDELAIFINGDGQFRVLIPKIWDGPEGSCPDNAYLTVACLIRLAQSDQDQFRRELTSWAENHITRNAKPKAKSPKPN